MQSLCAGCRELVDETVEVGYVTKRHYCKKCAVRARLFLDDEEALRKVLHDNFIVDRGRLIANFSEGGFKWPDIL